MDRQHTYKPGMRVIYWRERRSARPSPKAKDVRPEAAGEGYRYYVPKFWIVDAVLPNGRIVLHSRQGKIHELDPADPNLRPARFWERLRFGGRFPASQENPAGNALSASWPHSSR
jgi:hypothetical protein